MTNGLQKLNHVNPLRQETLAVKLKTMQQFDVFSEELLAGKK